ncbi:aspartate kinase [Pseudonocardia xinjiangensis]|uniref:aspartate kinase n=1 Tax=Pseudonocardia xinjiangensis TaxID=75289 RepID=UPI003D8EEDB6
METADREATKNSDANSVVTTEGDHSLSAGTGVRYSPSTVGEADGSSTVVIQDVYPGFANDRRAVGPQSSIVVWKFGGTSVADPARLRAAAERIVVAQRDGLKVVAVLSAMGSSTNDLVTMAYTVSERPLLRELDVLLSVGECISCALASMAVNDLGSHAVSLTGPQAGIHTDGQHGNAQLADLYPHRILDALDTGAAVLVTGYQGISPAGDVTTLGRGGSDTSAVAVAAALGLSECDIFTDVPGVFTADPRLVPDARKLPAVSRETMLQFAAAGAAVLQPRAVELAAAHDVDIHVRSSFTTDVGTWILEEEPLFETAVVTGVAHRERETLYAVRDVSPAAITAALAHRGVAIGTIGRDGQSLRFTAPDSEDAAVVAALSLAGVGVDVHNEFGSVSLVSAGIARRPDVTAQAMLALECHGIEPQMVTSAPSRVCFLIRTDAVHHAVRLLHDLFGLQNGHYATPTEDRDTYASRTGSEARREFESCAPQHLQ